ncbi:TetR/AcrR family transcriptional regulator [Nocardioides sp.]|uniref:TetR/AcrR family transcriptional regulator n=1 Tax=Nocardioides sp. TaxID=35761 RepID=UPI003562DAA8
MDRAAAVRGALVRLVAEHGFHGASMASVARAAGVATGTAYVHYASKEALVQATHLEVKTELIAAAVAGVGVSLPPRERFDQLWHGALDHLVADPDRARFLVQVEVSPFAQVAHDAGSGTPAEIWLASPALADLVAHLTALPLPLLFDLALGPVVRLVAAEGCVDPAIRPLLATACWRAVTDG